MEHLENRMVLDAEWGIMTPWEMEKKLSSVGYVNLETNVFVSEDYAFQYALENCLHGTLEEKKEFQEMLVEWFYSGNWVKEEE